jgi:hypothetical protein
MFILKDRKNSLFSVVRQGDSKFLVEKSITYEVAMVWPGAGTCLAIEEGSAGE